MFPIIYSLIHSLQPLLVPFCCLVAWTLFFGSLWILGVTTQEGIASVKRLHRIPCANCEFFTDDYRLKCPVRPLSALTEEAICCSDYTPSE